MTRVCYSMRQTQCAQEERGNFYVCVRDTGAKCGDRKSFLGITEMSQPPKPSDGEEEQFIKKTFSEKTDPRAVVS